MHTLTSLPYKHSGNARQTVLQALAVWHFGLRCVLAGAVWDSGQALTSQALRPRVAAELEDGLQPPD